MPPADPTEGAAASDPIARIERALARIERAAQASAFETDRLASRHATLRARVGDAVAALDRMAAGGTRD